MPPQLIDLLLKPFRRSAFLHLLDGEGKEGVKAVSTLFKKFITLSLLNLKCSMRNFQT
jgi:hypothetical protein